MANEITVRTSLMVKKGHIDYSSKPTAFQADMSVADGPTPGVVLCSTNGTDIDLSQLVTPGLCRFQNLDTTNFITVGRWDPVTNLFYPFMKIKPGETYVVRLHPDVDEEYAGTGTGTTGTASTLRAKANNAPAILLVEAFNE